MNNKNLNVQLISVKSIILIFFIIFNLSLNLFGKEILKYNGNLYDYKGEIILTKEEVEDFYIYTLGIDTYKEFFKINKEYETIYWELFAPRDDTFVIGKNKGDFIELSGKFRGKELKREILLKGDKWIQILPFGLGKTSDEEYFRIIATVGPRAMYSGRMLSKNMGLEEITVNNKNYLANRLKLRLTGILSFLWSGEYWYKLEDNILIKLEDSGSKLEIIK